VLRRIHIVIALSMLLVVSVDGTGMAADLVARCYDGERGSVALRAHRVFRISDGRLWINFDEGLLSWDGGRLTSLAPVLGGGGVFVYDVAEAPDGRRWVGHSAGITILDDRDRVIRSYAASDGLPRNAIGRILMLGDEVLAVSPSGIHRLDGEHWQPEAAPAPASDRVVPDLARLDNGRVAGLFGDRILVRESPGVWNAVEVATGDRVLRNPLALTEDRHGGVHVTFADRIVRVDAGFRGVREVAIPPRARAEEIIHGILVGDDAAALLTEAALWILTDRGWSPIHHPTRDPFDYRNRIAVDREGLIWVPHRRGCLKVERTDLLRWTRRDGLQANSLRAVVIGPDGSVVVTTSNGLASRGPGASGFSPPPPGDPGRAADFEALSVAQDGRVFAVARDRLAVVESGRARILDWSTRLDARLTDVETTMDRAIWVSTRNGVHRIDPSGERRHWTIEDGLPHEACFSLAPATDDGVWVATFGGGLARIHEDRVEVFGADEGLATDRLVDVEVGADGAVWTAGFGGVSRLDRDGRISVWREEDHPGLAASICVHPDDVGAWVFANGLWRIDGDGAVREVFSASDPAVRTSTASFHSSLAVGGDGSVYVASDLGGGLLQWLPRVGRGLEIRRDTRARIEALFVDGERLDPGGEPVAVGRGAGRLRFDFSAASLVREDATGFSYRMVGYDQGWSSPSRESEVEYTGVGSGARRFEVQAHFEDGRVSPVAALDLEVLAPWWRTPMALGIWLALALALGWTALRMRTASLLQRQRRLQEVVNQRTVELVDANTELRRLSVTDQLTGLSNRHGFASRIDDLVGDRRRAGRLLFLMMDLDRLKRINDEFGHEAGDAVLTEFARRVLAQVRAGDLAVRWGGDEVLVVARFDGDDNVLEQLVRRLSDGVRAQTVDVGGGRELPLTFSGGFACWPLAVPTVTWREVMRLADAALLIAKSSGRNRVVGVLEGSSVPDPIPGDPDDLMAARDEGTVELIEIR
jgi:diguanylate cyclase (GGDEF)-like protein